MLTEKGYALAIITWFRKLLYAQLGTEVFRQICPCCAFSLTPNKQSRANATTPAQPLPSPYIALGGEGGRSNAAVLFQTLVAKHR